MKPRNYPILTALLAILAGALHLYGQGTALTYQGRLNDGGSPASGLYDLRFGLYDAANGTGQQGNLVTNSATAVSNGLFTVTLDFGDQFPGADRWLEIGLRTNGSGAFTTLAPRQAIMPTPYAITAAMATGVPATGIGSGTAGINISGNAATATSALTADTATNLVGNGANLTALNANNLVNGTVPLARLSGLTDKQLDAFTWLLATNLDGGNATTLEGLTAAGFWRLGGNAGSTPGINFLGTTDNQELQFKVNSLVGLRLLSTKDHPSLIGGDASNFAANDCFNTFIGGGMLNSVTNTTYYSVIGGGFGNKIIKLSPDWYPDNAVIGGGINNTNAGLSSVIPGGEMNLAYGQHTFAAGYRAKATNEGTFVWADSTEADFSSTAAKQFLIRAAGGVGIGTNHPHAALEVAGTVLAQNFIGNVAGLAGTVTNTLTFNPTAGAPFLVGNSLLVANLNADKLDGYSSSAFWNVGGNAGTGGSALLGTSDNQPLDLISDNLRGLRLQYSSRFSGSLPFISTTAGINVIGGCWDNTISNNIIGGTIAGGGYVSSFFFSDAFNAVTGDFGSVGGGYNNTAGTSGTVPGGYNNSATGTGSFAAGANASATHNYSFVWGDGYTTSSSTNRDFTISAHGGVNMTTPRGISLEASDTPIITREWDIFASNAGANKAGLGRWGLFMEPSHLVAGIPGEDVPGRYFSVAKYSTNGTYTTLITVNQAGNLTCNSLTILGGADLAEPFAMSHNDIPEGSVVVIDEDHPGQLKLSNQAYDTRVAGIVSGAQGVHPGIQMKQAGLLDSGKNVALSGRVYVKADAVNGAIKPGDLLTTSGNPGHAMKVADHAKAAGAVLGKAMTGLAQGKGMVLVLVTLQ